MTVRRSLSAEELDALSRPPLPELVYSADDEAPAPWEDEPTIGTRPPSVQASAIATVTLADLMAEPDRPLSMLLPGLVPAVGVTALAGDPKIGKTLFAHQLALLAGVPRETEPRMLGRPVAGGLALFVVEEGSREGLAQKARRQLAGLELEASAVTYAYRQRIRLDARRSVEDLRALVDVLRPALIVLDPFNRAHGADENRPADMTPVMDAAAGIAYDFACAVLLVHHLTKPVAGQHRSGAERLRGAGSIRSGTDANLTMTAAGDRTVRIDGEFRDLEETFLLARLHPSSLIFEPTELADAKVGTSALVAFLAERGQASVRDVAAHFEVAKNTAQAKLDELDEVEVVPGLRGARFYRIRDRS